MMGFGDRLKILRGEERQQDFANRAGINVNTLRAYEKDKNSPSLETAVEICSRLGVAPQWLLLGVGEKGPEPLLLAQDDGSYRKLVKLGSGEPNDRDLVMVKKVKARLSAGTGSLETSDEVDGRYAFRSDWLRSKGRVGKMVLMDVTGDSMEPDIRDRDMVLIDESQTDVIPGAVFAIGLDDEVLIKYVDKEPGLYILRSANTNYRPIPIDLKDESLNVRIIGRVIWWCREAR